MKKIITSILLFFVAILIFMLVLPFGLLYQIIAIFKTKERSIYFSDYFFKLAQCVDQLGNVINRQLFNDVLLNKNSTNVFGNNQETISSVIGKNFETNTLSKTGIWLNKILNLIQPNHAVISIEDNINYPTDQTGL